MEKGPVEANHVKKAEKPSKIKKEAQKSKNHPLEAQNLTEKQLRKLEWEKKLAEQKLKSEDGNVSKSELKTKRREQQEAQRQAKSKLKAPKEEVKLTHVKPQPKDVTVQPQHNDVTTKHTNDTRISKAVIKPVQTKGKSAQLVLHLYRTPNAEYLSKLVNYKDVHPVFVRLGIQYKEKVILGSNARCLALLSAIKHLVDDLQTPPKQDFARYLEAVLHSCTNYLQHCRPLAVSMTNALRYFKLQLTQMDNNLSDNEKKAYLQDIIDIYISNDIKRAWDAISLKVREKITNDDVILIYGCSSLITKILLEAHRDGKKFHVIVADNRPLLEGREMLRRLVSANIKCTYILISAIAYVMEKVSKVLLGAHALLTNGYVMSRIGTAQVALVAHAFNKPVLVCCEIHKFSERVQTDSFVYNEIGKSDSLLTLEGSSVSSPLTQLKDNAKLNTLNLLYDVTPPDLVTAVVTELAILPCTSVPVVLRISAK